MKHYAKILFLIFATMICAIGFAADQPACKTSGKNCPMNNGGACNFGKSCDCLPGVAALRKPPLDRSRCLRKARHCSPLYLREQREPHQQYRTHASQLDL